MAETNTGYPFIYLDGNPDVVIESTGGCISIPIVAQNCTFSSCTVSNNNNTALTVTVANQVITFCMQATDNTAFTLADTLSLTFYDTDGKHFQQGCRVYQKGTQDSGNLGTVTINGQSAFTFDYYTGGTAYLYVSSTVDLTNAVVDGTQTFVNANASPFYRVEHADGGYKVKLGSQPIGYEYSEGSEPPISDLVGALQIRINAEDGNTYILNNVLISQPYYTPKPIETQKDARFLESTTSVTSAVQYTSATAKVGSNSDTTQYDGTVYFISAATYPSGSFPADFPMGDFDTPSYVSDVPIYLNGDGEIRSCAIRVPENNSGQDRQAVLYFSAVTIYKDKETWEDIQNINEIITFTINQSRGTGSTSGDTSGSTSGDTSGSTSGDTSGSTSGDTSGYTPATGSCIEVTYDTSLYNGYTISSWPSGTKIIGGSGAVQSDYSAMIYTGWIDHAEFEDGTPLPRRQYRTGFYDFGQEGIYTIRYYTNGRDVTYGIPLLPEYSFQDCGRVVSVKIIHSGDSTKDIQAIGGKAFAKTSLACITLPEGIRDIDTYAFSEVDTLSCITFPASLSNPVSQYAPSIAGWVLESATSLNKIFAKGMTAPPIGSNTFKAIPSGGTLYYPVGSDYSTWLDALPNWTWATYDPYAVDTCDCAHDGENVPIIESGTTNPPSGTPYISLSGYSNNYLAGTGSCVSLPIIATNCTYSSFTATIDYNPNLTAHSVASVTEENGSLKLCLTSNPLTGDVQVAIITVTLYDTNGNSYLHYLGLNQYGNENPDPPIPSGQTINSGSTSHTITYSGCPLVFDHSASTGTWNTLPNVTTAGTTDNWSLTYDVPANDTDSARTITYYYLRYSGETCEDLVNTVSYTISQNAGSGSTPTPGTTPDPWSDTGDTAYTWYKDDSLLRVLPPSRVLSYDEETAYWPVTAHTFDNVGVRASGDVVFNYELIADGSAEYNSHSLYAHTQNNTGTTQQVSTIKLVAFSGSSAYSASTVLMKNPDSHGWITASPNPVNGASSQNSVNVYLTLTNCERNISKETTDNAEFDAATWVSVSRVNNTALTFNFQANYSNQARSTYYYAYGLDSSGNNVYCRIDITQEANSMGITITPDRTSLGKPAGSFTARVESTESGNFSFSAASWMVVRSYVPESQKAGTLYVDYYENTGNYTRVGDITVSQQISTAPYILTARTQISQTSTADTAYIRVTPSSISVDRTAGVVEAQVSYAGLATVPALVQNEGNMSIVSYNLDSGLITVAYGANDTSMDKYKNFTVTAMSSNGNVIEANFTITQGGTGLPVAPIWRDYVITVPTPGQGYINYNINYDGAVVYTGRAYGMGQDNIEIYYNHLCKPFLSNHIDFTEGYQSIRDWLGNFIITSPELGDITSVSFYEDYSYVNRDITNVMSLNNPIINEVVEGSYVPFSFFITGTSGNVSIMQNGQQITGLTVNDNEQHRYFVEAEKGKTYSSLGAVYKTISVCSARYSLYYINSYGGVDVLPFKGKSFKKTDNITRLNYSRSFRNNTLEFENVNYMNEMKPVWELNTSYMVDSQSRKMHELVESTCVYLYDAEEQTYTPVVMTDKKLEYKTFYNQGRRFYTYTINVEESQSKERR